MDLSAGKYGLHLIHGPNEAGKSSALRALRALFYGIPARTDDNFVHPYGSLRIGAELAHTSGDMLHVIRRKGNRDTLRAGDDMTVVAESVISEYLGNVSENLFETLFGIDHDLLRQGGELILQGGGNVGEILFSAGTGMANLRALEQQLEDDADRLFKKTGTNPSINSAGSELKRHREEVRQARLASEEWTRHHENLERSKARLASLGMELEKAKREKARIERIRNTIPFLSERRELMERLSNLGEVVRLPDGFSADRQKQQTRQAVARETEADARREIERIEKELASLPVFESLLGSADIMRELEQSLGSQRKAQRDLPKLRDQLAGLMREAEALLREARPDLKLSAVDEIRLDKKDRVLIQNLGNRHQAICQEEERSRSEAENLTQRLEQAKERLAACPPPFDATELTLAARRALALGDMERQHQAVLEEVERLHQQSTSQLCRLPGWAGSLADLETMRLPSLETIEHFEAKLGELDRRLLVVREQFDKVMEEQGDCEQKIQELFSVGAIPTESDLLAARGRREQAWSELRRIWLENSGSSAGSRAEKGSLVELEDLMRAHEAAVRHADDMVDRLRREAARVANLASLQSRQKAAEARRKRFEDNLAQLEGTRAEFESDWAGLWAPLGIACASPKEMRAWHHAAGEILRQSSAARERQVHGESLKQQIDKHRHALSKGLIAADNRWRAGDATLRELVDHAQEVLETGRKNQEIRARLEREIAEGERGLSAARKRGEAALREWTNWSRQWANAMESLGLPANASPEQANDAIAQLQSLFAKLEKAEDLRGRIEGIGRDADQFTEWVGQLASRVDMDPVGTATEALADRLIERFREALRIEEKRSSLSRQREQFGEKVQRAHEQLVESSAALDAMCLLANCASAEDLPRVERESEEVQKLRTRLEQVESQLRRIVAGARLDEWDEEVRHLDVDALPFQLEQVTAEVERLEKERSDHATTAAVEENELKRMDGGAAAADAEQYAQELVARIASDAEHYVRLRLAKTVLQKAVERYRERHQGPVLRRASDLFSELTRGSFLGLREEYEEGSAVIKGIRAGGKEFLGVKAMSEGTMDQLYLAIRLATLEAHFEKCEPIPFIVDDVLINFDDERSAACLSVLARFSRRTQVLFFTHHEHLLELARRHLRKGDFFVHELTSRPARIEGTLFTT